MPITQLPDPPLRSQSQQDFSDTADAFLAALPTLVDEINGLDIDTAGTNAAIATAKATEAASSAAAAFAAAGQNATSTTTLTSGLGTKSLTLAQTGKVFSVGQTVNIADSDATNVMTGYVIAFNSGTGAMTVDVQIARGDLSSVSSWIVSVGGAVPFAASNVPIERAIRRAKLAFINSI
jgi:hypothetical protein